MEIDNLYPEKGKKYIRKLFLHFYFLNVDIFLTMQDPTSKFYIHTKNITVKGTVSQISDIGPGSFSIKYLLKRLKKYIKIYPFFDIK